MTHNDDIKNPSSSAQEQTDEARPCESTVQELNNNTAQPAPQENVVYKKAISVEGFVCLAVIVAILVGMSLVMGFSNALSSLFNTAYYLLTDVVWYLLALIVVMGAISSLMDEFGVIAIANKLFSPLMKPLYGMPGATTIAILTCFMSDNPAVLTLANDKNFVRYFKKYQLGAITNIATAFGMGLIVFVSMLSIKGEHFVAGVMVGLLSAIIGSILVTRLMQIVTIKKYGKEAEASGGAKGDFDVLKYRQTRKGSVMYRAFASMLDGGANGVKVGMGLIPGVMIIATMVLMLTNGCPESGVYTGAAGEGVGLIPMLGDVLMPVFRPLFGFETPEAIAVPLTALGSAGAALSIVPDMASKGILTANNVAVFTAMCMFWSGYLSTHVSMMDALNFRELTGWSILFHTIGGIFAGVTANLLFKLVMLII